MSTCEMADGSYVSLSTSLDEVYDTDTSRAKKRYADIKEAFEEQFSAAPQYYARAPGRVNLIGEHIDYEGYGVLPMAIAQDTVVAIRKHGMNVVIANLDAEHYPTKTLEIDPSLPVDRESGHWTNYVMAAYKGVYEFLEQATIAHGAETGLQILVDGEVPTGSGLSSSSALVCATAIAILAVKDVLHLVTKSDIAQFTSICERHCGTESGGMDQAISVMAKRGFAKHIEFGPVRGTDVSLPPSAVFVVANSLTVSKKAETADQRYNLRVFECRAAAMLLGYALDFPNEEVKDIETLRDIEDLTDLGERASRVLEGSVLTYDLDSRLSTCQALVKRSIATQSYCLEEVQDFLNFQMRDVCEKSPNNMRVLRLVDDGHKELHLYKRALHVFEESQRVTRVKKICEDDEIEEEEKLKKIGEHMNASHVSCRDQYDCSCPELEELVAVCNSFGAIGSRLTGAGWGGCVVALVRDGQQEQFIQNVKDTFYSKRVQSHRVKEEDVSQCIFASKPSSGAAVFELD